MTFNTDQNSYKDFRSLLKERTSGVVAWVGSGLSAPAGIPTWKGLRDRLIDELRNKMATLESDDANRTQEKIKKILLAESYWVAFDILKKALGKTTWRSVVRNALASNELPSEYNMLWRLGLHGVLTVNLDRLVTKSFLQVMRGSTPLEYSGSEISRAAQALGAPRPFIVNLHGSIDNSDTWVLTKSDLSKIQSNDGYATVIRSILTTKTVLFVGISADDLAIGGHLEALARMSIETNPHYWITSRRDEKTDRWAEDAGIRVIRYESKSGDHSELGDFFQDLLRFVPREENAPPVAAQISLPFVGLPSPDELSKSDAETIRRSLNAEAQVILREPNPVAYERFEKLCDDYEEAAHRSWFVSTKPNKNRILGYVVQERVATGGFGTVYRASDDSGHDLALKLLRNDVRTKPEMLQSFRRGVRSMRILSTSRVSGMVPYVDASEIPAFVVMKWVEGPNLHDAVEARQLGEWDTFFKVAVPLAEIIRNAHRLPERVLHRDLRPSNVMLENYWSKSDSWKVVVTDFDLSWHVGSEEQSVIHGWSTTGYLAPEQMQKTEGVSTRNAAVDSFGFGMTLFFVLAKRDPMPSEHRHKTWSVSVDDAVRALPSASWLSLPRRLGRLIINCTRHIQAERWDMSQIESELKSLQRAMNNPEEVLNVEFLAEELAARAYGDRYEWDGDSMKAQCEFASGANVALGIRYSK